VKPLQFNMSKFKKVGGDKNHTIMQHEDGHQITIAHAPLPALQRKQLEKMPMAEGGEIKGVHKPAGKEYPGESTAGQYTKAAKQSGRGTEAREDNQIGAREEHERTIKESREIKPKLQGLADGGDVQPQDDDLKKELDQSDAQPDQSSNHTININVGGQPAQQAPASIFGQQEPQVQAPQTQPAQSNPGLMNPNQTANVPQAVRQEQALAPQQAAIDTAKGQAMANVEKGYNQQRTAIAQQDAEHIQDLQQHTDDFAKYMNDNPINLNHWAESRSSAQKVSTAAALFLGGFQGGINGSGQNPALDFINKQIDRDIDAQKSRAEQQKSIYGAYNHLYDNENIATNLAKASMLDIYNHQVQQVAQKLATPQAQLNAKMFQIKTAQEKAQLLRDASQDPGIDSAYQRSQQLTKQPQLSSKEQEALAVSNKNYGPQNLNNGLPIYHILTPDADNRVKYQLPLDPFAKNNIDKIQNQVTAAQQVEKLLNGPSGNGVGGIHDVFQRMYTNSGEGNKITGLGGAMQRAGSKVTGAITGAASHLLGGGKSADAVSAIGGQGLGLPAFTEAQKEYELNQTNLKTDLASALKGIISVNDIDALVDKYSPGYADSKALVQKKEEGFVNALKKALQTSQLSQNKLLAK
jgi:hypothetical protein